MPTRDADAFHMRRAGPAPARGEGTLRDKSEMCCSEWGRRKCRIARRTSLVSQPAKHLNSSALLPTRIDRLGLWSSWAGHRHRPRSICHVPPSFRQSASPSNSSFKDFIVIVSHRFIFPLSLPSGAIDLFALENQADFRIDWASSVIRSLTG